VFVRARSTSGASIEALGDVSASGCGRVVFRSMRMSIIEQARIEVGASRWSDLPTVVLEILCPSPKSSSPPMVDLGCDCS